MGRFHSDPSIWLLGKVGILFRSNAEFPFIRWTDNFWYKWPVATDSSTPVCLERAAASFLICWTAVSCHPPKVSTGRGRKTIPSLWQAAPTPPLDTFQLKA